MTQHSEQELKWISESQYNKNSSVDEIANVNVFTTTSYMYRPAPTLIEPTSYLC